MSLSDKKILILKQINKWRYLSIEELSLLNQNSYNANWRKIIQLEKEGYLRSVNYGNKKYLFMTKQGSKIINTIFRSNLKLNYLELNHQNLMIRYIAKLKLELDEYLIDIEIKMDPKWEKKYIPDIVILKEDKKEYIEIERTAKSKIRLEEKTNLLASEILEENVLVKWVVDSEKMFNYLFNFLNQKYSYILGNKMFLEKIEAN